MSHGDPQDWFSDEDTDARRQANIRGNLVLPPDITAIVAMIVSAYRWNAPEFEVSFLIPRGTSVSTEDINEFLQRRFGPWAYAKLEDRYRDGTRGATSHLVIQAHF